MPEEGFVLIWRNSSESKRHLSYHETAMDLERRLERRHLTNRESVAADLETWKLEHQSGRSIEGERSGDYLSIHVLSEVACFPKRVYVLACTR